MSIEKGHILIVKQGQNNTSFGTWVTLTISSRILKYLLFVEVVTPTKSGIHYRPPSEGWRKVIFSVCPHFGGGGVPGPSLRFLGGSWSQIFGGGVPGLRFSGGGSWSQIFRGGTQSQIFRGGPGLRFLGGGGTQSQIFWGGYPVLVKGTIFDTRFGLIHVQTGEKNFCRGTPPPSKGKNFWHQIWLDTCSDWEKSFLSRDPPPPAIARNGYGYAAGGMPLAFMQEDFLVMVKFQNDNGKTQLPVNNTFETLLMCFAFTSNKCSIWISHECTQPILPSLKVSVRSRKWSVRLVVTEKIPLK